MSFASGILTGKSVDCKPVVPPGLVPSSCEVGCLGSKRE